MNFIINKPQFDTLVLKQGTGVTITSPTGIFTTETYCIVTKSDPEYIIINFFNDGKMQEKTIKIDNVINGVFTINLLTKSAE